jgi:hypothetical protein
MFDGLVCVALTQYNDHWEVLRLAQNVVIPATTEALVRLTIPGKFLGKTSLMETFPPLKNKFFTVAGALIHPTRIIAIARILNVGTIPRRITTGTPIARLSAIDLTDNFNQAMLAIDQSNNPNRDIAVNHTLKNTPLYTSE